MGAGFGIGIFLDGRNPPAWARPWRDHYRRQLEIAVTAESLGAASVWLTEHHRFADGYLTQPLVLAAAIAARTSSVRIGTAVVQAPLRHPAHIAEEAAVADLIAGGRLELGLGPGYAAHERALFGVGHVRPFAATDATLEEVRRLLDDGGVTPPPVQRPFPLWLGYQGPKNAYRAGRLGVGLLSLDRVAARAYAEGLVAGGRREEVARLAGTVDLVVADDPELAWARITPHYLHQLNSYREAQARPPLSAVDLGDRRGAGRVPVAVPLQVLSVGEAIDVVRARTAGLPVAHVYTWASVAGMDDDLVCRHLELLLGPVRAAVAP